MTTTRWDTAGPAPAGYDKRLSLSNFVYDACRQADYALRDLGVVVIPDEGLYEHLDGSAPAYLVPTVIGADDVRVSDGGYINYGGLEVLWTVYTADSGGVGTAWNDFPASHHADVVAAVIALFINRNIFAVAAATGQYEDPVIHRGLFNGINQYSRVESDTNGYLMSTISASAVAYIADERTPQVESELTIGPVSELRLGLSDGSGPVRFRRYDIATGVWSDVTD